MIDGDPVPKYSSERGQEMLSRGAAERYQSAPSPSLRERSVVVTTEESFDLAPASRFGSSRIGSSAESPGKMVPRAEASSLFAIARYKLGI